MKVSVALRAKFWGFQLAQQLQNRNVLHKLYTSYYGNFLGKDNSTGYNLEKSKVKLNLFSAVTTYRIKFKNQLKQYKQFGDWAARQIKEEDIIVTWGLSALPVIIRAKQLGIISILERGSSHVIYQRNILFEEFKKFDIDSTDLEKSFSGERIERELEEYERADYISVPSSFVENSFVANGIKKEKLIKIPFGVNLNEFKNSDIRPDKFRVIFVGSLSLRKGVHYLLQAYSELRLPDSELWLVGAISDEIKPFLDRYEGNFKYFKPVAQSRLHEYYHQSSVFVISSIEEGLAMVQVQAMACGLPVICTTNTGGDDLIEDGKEGFIIPIRDISSIKEKIEFLYYNRGKCAAMGEMARRKVESGFTWDDYGEKVYNKYMGILRLKKLL